MKTVKVKSLGSAVPAVVVGCMRQAGFTRTPFTPQQMNRFIHGALELGANYFDHADIYGAGRAEQVFGDAICGDASIRREELILQSKCGIVPGCYDSSREHILEAVDGILQRLKTEYLDVLLLHRPDALIEPEEVAEAFTTLQQSGKVRHFGVSNYKPGQIALLAKYLEQPLVIDQMQLSVVHAGMISAGIEADMTTDGAVERDGGLVDYCRLNRITVQAWSPFQAGGRAGSFLGNEDYPELNRALEELAEQYGVTPTGIAAAWILRHPADMQVVAGTTRLERLKEIVDASSIRLTRPEWYRLYRAAGHILP